jgi:hypothetical protein
MCAHVHGCHEQPAYIIIIIIIIRAHQTPLTTVHPEQAPLLRNGGIKVAKLHQQKPFLMAGQ